jgi:hypothetical protein
MLSRRLLTFSLLTVAVSGYLYFFEHISGFIWLFGAGVLIAMSTYILQHQINWWWYQKYPPSLHPEMQKMFLHAGEFYKQLNTAERKIFDTRTRLFVEAKEFIPQGFDKVAEDIKYMIAYYAVMVSFRKSEYLFDPYHRIVIYLHPFITPNVPDHVHTYEIEHEDGTLIFALEQLTAGFLSPAKFYQIGLHAFAEIFTQRYLSQEVIADPEAIWESLSEIGRMSKQSVEDFTGVAQSNPIPVMLHHWFTFRESMLRSHSQLYRTIEKWVG